MALTFFKSWYSASGVFTAKPVTVSNLQYSIASPVSTDADRYTIVSPSSIQVEVGGSSLEQFSSQSLSLNSDSFWDFGQSIGTWTANTSYDVGNWVRPSASWVADGTKNTRTDYGTKPMYAASWENQVVSATSTDTTNYAYYAFNQTTNSWKSNADPATTPQCLMLDRGRAIVINKFAIQAMNNATSYFPLQWTLEGSNSGSSAIGDASGANGWTVIHTQSSDATDPGSNTFSSEYKFTNSTAYRYYRFRVTKGSNSRCAINELKLIQAPSLVYRCTTAGTSHSTTEPTWPLTSTVSDNGVVWTAYPDYIMADNRAGLDAYIYACIPSVGKTPKLILSSQATTPWEYTTSNSRKIGGFHCLCSDMFRPKTRANSTAYVIGDTIASGSYWYRCVVAGTSGTDTALGTTIDGTTVDGGTLTWICEEAHPLINYLTGDIIPYSVWDLLHRAENHDNRGSVYDPKTQLWIYIYFPSLSGLSAVSIYNGTILDTVTWFKCVDYGLNSSVRMMKYSEFAACAYGSNEMTNVYGGADTIYTGGHSDTTGRRMISHIGCEDCCGLQWQYLLDTMYAFTTASSHTHTLTLTGDSQTGVVTSVASVDVAPAWAYRANTNYHGSLYIQGTSGLIKPSAGGKWNSGSAAGSLDMQTANRPYDNGADITTRYCCKTKEL